jgi:L-ascorbate metabolism protein UlaG (beta-lactamase superfamily)
MKTLFCLLCAVLIALAGEISLVVRMEAQTASATVGEPSLAKSELTVDRLPTSEGEVIIHPINHASLVLEWNGKVIYVDPVGGGAKYQDLPRADLILLTHAHRDHLDPNTLAAVKGNNTKILAPSIASADLPANLQSLTATLTNGASATVAGVHVLAVPAYNLTKAFHPKGVGNGYVLTLGGKRIYLSGDTEATPEMAALRDIDAAFLCMNLPYTMTVDQAVGVVRAFRPKIVYPYHSAGSDLNSFKKQLETEPGIKVRLLKWY